MSQMVWSYKRLPALDNRVGFVEVSKAEATTLIASGDVQDPKIGAKALKYIDDAYAAPATPVKPGTMAKPSASAITATGAKVTWVAPTTGDAVGNYEVKVTKAGVPITGSPFTMAGATLTKTLSGLTATTAYIVTVKAINSAGSVSAAPLEVTTNP